MARPRRSASTNSNSRTMAQEFICPECGKTFTRAASLGAHRNRAHGVIGASKRRSTPQPASAPSTSTTKTRRRRQSGPPTGSRRSTAGSTRQRDGQTRINRDQLLEALFPNGVPPREDVIKQVSNWLDQADRITKL